MYSFAASMGPPLLTNHALLLQGNIVVAAVPQPSHEPSAASTKSQPNKASSLGDVPDTPTPSDLSDDEIQHRKAVRNRKAAQEALAARIAAVQAGEVRDGPQKRSKTPIASAISVSHMDPSELPVAPVATAAEHRVKDNNRDASSTAILPTDSSVGSAEATLDVVEATKALLKVEPIQTATHDEDENSSNTSATAQRPPPSIGKQNYERPPTNPRSRSRSKSRNRRHRAEVLADPSPVHDELDSSSSDEHEGDGERGVVWSPMQRCVTKKLTITFEPNEPINIAIVGGESVGSGSPSNSLYHTPIVVESVDTDSRAYRHQLRTGDELLTLNGQPVVGYASIAFENVCLQDHFYILTCVFTTPRQAFNEAGSSTNCEVSKPVTAARVCPFIRAKSFSRAAGFFNKERVRTTTAQTKARATVCETLTKSKPQST